MGRRTGVALVVVALALGVGLIGCQSSPATNPTSQTSDRAATAAPSSGQPSSQGTPAAQNRPANNRNRIAGTIHSVIGQSVVLNTAAGQVNVAVADNTRILTTATIPASQIKVGDRVMVVGSQGSDGSLTATSIRVESSDAVTAFQGQSGQRGGPGAPSGQPQTPQGDQPNGQRRAPATPPAGGNGSWHGVAGTVAAVGTKDITITTNDGSTTVKLGDNVTVRTTTVGSLADLKVGATALVTGDRGADGTVAATSISLGDDLTNAN